ncbi:MAG: hypothetical protein IIZ93_01510 [Acidaminococcaceae bacterium]|nr:hypothetical protein [Acidaminococcaceae bacterium]
MLKPIPAKILRSTVTVKACTGLDRYQNPTYTESTVKKVHIQPTNEIRKTTDNTDCTLRSILFADGRHSTPLDWWSIFQTAHDIGGDVKVVCRGVEYTVMAVDELRDDTDQFHHWEIALV